MTDLRSFRAEIAQKFRDNTTITIFGFYGQFSTSLLEKTRKGFERDYDAACQGEPYRQPLDWLTERISVISRILDDREADRPRTVDEKIWGKVENGSAKPIRVKWNSRRETNDRTSIK